MEFKGVKTYPVKISLELFVISKLSDLKFFLTIHRIFSYDNNIYVCHSFLPSHSISKLLLIYGGDDDGDDDDDEGGV